MYGDNNMQDTSVTMKSVMVSFRSLLIARWCGGSVSHNILATIDA